MANQDEVRLTWEDQHTVEYSHWLSLSENKDTNIEETNSHGHSDGLFKVVFRYKHTERQAAALKF